VIEQRPRALRALVDDLRAMHPLDRRQLAGATLRALLGLLGLVLVFVLAALAVQ
jgi:hypothetical protein